MQTPYAKVGENGVNYNGPPVADAPAAPARFGLFGPGADSLAANLSPLIDRYGGRYSLVGVSSDVPWGQASSGLVKLIYEDHVLGIIADRPQLESPGRATCDQGFRAGDRGLGGPQPDLRQHPLDFPLAAGNPNRGRATLFHRRG